MYQRLSSSPILTGWGYTAILLYMDIVELTDAQITAIANLDPEKKGQLFSRLEEFDSSQTRRLRRLVFLHQLIEESSVVGSKPFPHKDTNIAGLL